MALSDVETLLYQVTSNNDDNDDWEAANSRSLLRARCARTMPLSADAVSMFSYCFLRMLSPFPKNRNCDTRQRSAIADVAGLPSTFTAATAPRWSDH